jgi:hypothetical protein
MVTPVVVKPDMFSRNASDIFVHVPVRRSGNVPIKEKIIQVKVTIRNASRLLKLFFEFRPAYFNVSPKTKAIKEEYKKASVSVSW